MALGPSYGETPLEGEELDALLPAIRALLGENITKAAVFDLEQGVQEQVTERTLTAVLAGDISLDQLLTDAFVRELHRDLYADIWVWGGVQRIREINIGVAPEQISIQLRESLDTIRYRWANTFDWTPRVLGIAAHADVVRIHPFVDGNGRSTRLLADLIHFAAQPSGALEEYDWEVDKPRYIELLRQYDGHRDPTDLASFVPVRRID
jgi:fido (protein-threonine AMPylation protein)